MQVIDVLIGMTKDILPSNFRFYIGDDDVVYLVENNSLYIEQYGGGKEEVEWFMYKEWLNKPIQIIDK